MKKVDYNIEFGHIFVDERFSFHQRESSKIANEFIKNLKKQNKTYVASILIDDYQPTYSYLDIYKYFNQIKKMKVLPTYLVYQTQLISLAHKLISLINKKNIKFQKKHFQQKSDKDTVLLELKNISSISLKKEYFAKTEDYIETPVMIAAWYLLRLGIFQKKEIIKKTNYTPYIPFMGHKILTILPKKYKKIDETAKEILSYSGYKKILKNIENIYF